MITKSYIVLSLALLICSGYTSAIIPQGLTAMSNKLNSIIPSQYLGGAIAGFVGNESYLLTAGYSDFSKTKLFNATTIIRIASDTKLIGTVAFLRLVDKGTITGFEPVKQFIPSFANTTVIDPVIDPCNVTLSNPLSVNAGSNILIIAENHHGRKVGDTIAIFGSSAIKNISANLINQLFIVNSVINKHKYTVLLSSASNASDNDEGGAVTIITLPEGSKKTVYKGVDYYYTTVPLVRDISIWHILTHTLGYEYLILGEAGGYADSRNSSGRRQILSAIQAGIYAEKLIPMPYPIPAVPGTFNTILEWSNAMANVSLLFQPGEDWSYGPTLSLLGSLIEAIDGRSVENYIREEVTEPLGMIDSGFFIQDNDTRRADKLSRIQDLTLRVAPATFVNLLYVPGLQAYADYFYGSSRPRSLALIASGMYSTLNDRSLFYKALLNNGRYETVNGTKYLLSPATIALLSHNRINDLIPAATFPPIKNFKWGLGVAVGAGTDDDSTLGGQTKHSIFWSGLFGSAFNVDWSNDSVFNYATNTFDILAAGNVKKLLTNLHYALHSDISVNNDDVNPTRGSSVKIY